MATKPVSLESFLAGEFPVFGLDLSGQIGEQRPLTTRTGKNVRTYEVLTMRARGGSRAGLSQFVPEQVSGEHRIDHLNMITDPTVAALIPQSDLSADNPDAVPDPSTNNFQQRVEPDTYVRREGSPRVFRGPKPVLRVTANNQFKPFGQQFTFSGNEYSSEGLLGGDSITHVELFSDGAPATALQGSYGIPIAVEGVARFYGPYPSLAKRYKIIHVAGIMIVSPPGHWELQTLTAVWSAGALVEVSVGQVQADIPNPPVADERLRGISSAAFVSDAVGAGHTWSASAQFRDFIYNFFNVSFAPNGHTSLSAIGPTDGLPNPSIGQTYEGVIELDCTGTFDEFGSGPYTYDCGSLTWTAIWKYVTGL